MNSFPCPNCKEPVVDRCWRCGWNTASYEEDMNACKPKDVWEDPLAGKPANWVNLTPTGDIKHFVVSSATEKLTGLSSSYYELPEGCKELQDLIEYKNMNFARGNIFKATYRLGDKPGTDQIYDYEKIIWFAQREIERLKNAQNTTD